MLIGKEISEFAASRAAQDAAQTVMIRSASDWRATASAAPVLDGLARYGAGEDLGDNPSLSALFTQDGAAAGFVGEFLVSAAEAMARKPLAQPCFRHSCEGGYTLVYLANSGRATLSLVVAEGDGGIGRSIPESAVFTAAERHEAVLQGNADGEIAWLDEERLEREERRFARGDILHLPAWTTRIFHRVEASLVCLRLARTPERMPATRQVSLSGGSVMHEAAGDPRDTRHELMSALLAAMQRQDAVPALAKIASAAGHGPTRWQALKGALAMDTAAGLAALTAVAADGHDPLHKDAAVMQAMLAAQHPVLGTIGRG